MIINMTPHPVNIVDGITIPASGQQIRLAVTTQPGAPIDGVPTSATTFGSPVGLPDYQEGTWYIVSQLSPPKLCGMPTAVGRWADE